MTCPSVLIAVAFFAVAAPPITPPVGAAEPTPKDLASLRAQLTAQAESRRFAHACWGVQIVSLDTGVEVFAHQAQRLFVPASNTKLYTGALALDRLGPDFRIRTSVYAPCPPDRRGVIKGDLVVFGRGDPTLAARFHGGNLEATLAPLADAVLAAGVRRVRGDLVADETFFVGEALGAGWNWDDLPWYYGAEVSALTLNDNALEVTVAPGATLGSPAQVILKPPTGYVVVSNRCLTASAGAGRQVRIDRPLASNVLWVTGHLPIDGSNVTESVSVHRPAAWFAQSFRAALDRRGIRVDGSVKVVSDPDGTRQPRDLDRWVELGAVESMPLSELLGLMLKPSQNQHAQLLLLQVGAAARRSPRAAPSVSGRGPGPEPVDTAESAGTRALREFLGEAGIPTDEVLVEEGSGLTRRNLVTPAATVRLLRFMAGHRHAAVFCQALPLAGVDGTLRNRMKDTPAAGNARAKTGTLRYVYALSGYVASAAGERFAFSILLNNYRPAEGDRPARAELDEVVATLASLTWRTGS